MLSHDDVCSLGKRVVQNPSEGHSSSFYSETLNPPADLATRDPFPHFNPSAIGKEKSKHETSHMGKDRPHGLKHGEKHEKEREEI